MIEVGCKKIRNILFNDCGCIIFSRSKYDYINIAWIRSCWMIPYTLWLKWVLKKSEIFCLMIVGVFYFWQVKTWLHEKENLIFGQIRYYPIYLHLIFGIFQLEISSLDFISSLNWIFLPTVVCKIQVWNRQKIQFIKLDISKWRIAKIKCR